MAIEGGKQVFQSSAIRERVLRGRDLEFVARIRRRVLFFIEAAGVSERTRAAGQYIRDTQLLPLDSAASLAEKVIIAKKISDDIAIASERNGEFGTTVVPPRLAGD